MPLDVDALTALSDLVAIAESGVDARSLDDVVVPSWVSAPYDEHLTVPLLRPEAPELAAPPAPLGLPLSEPRFAVPAPGLAVLVDGGSEPEPLHLDRLPLDPDAPAVPEWPQHLRAGWVAVAAAAAHQGARLREADLRGRAVTAARSLLALVRDVGADLREMGPRLARLAAVTAGAALVTAVLTPVLAPQRADGLSALSVLASASPLSFGTGPGPAPVAGTPAPQAQDAGSAEATSGREAPGTGSGTTAAPDDRAAGSGADPGTAAGAAEESAAGPLDVLRSGLPFGQEGEARQPRAVAAAATALPSRSGTGRRLVIGSDRAWAVAADGSVVRTWPVVRGTCPSPGSYRVRQGPARSDAVRAALWAARGDGRARIVHGASAPCAAAAAGDARWLRGWTSRGTVVVILG